MSEQRKNHIPSAAAPQTSPLDAAPAQTENKAVSAELQVAILPKILSIRISSRMKGAVSASLCASYPSAGPPYWASSSLSS